jgi:hypothetical protein
MEQDWLKTNLAKFARMLQGQRDLVTVGKMLLSELAPLVHAQQGTIYRMAGEGGGERDVPSLLPLASYAVGSGRLPRLSLGQGLVGQCAVEK